MRYHSTLILGLDPNFWEEIVHHSTFEIVIILCLISFEMIARYSLNQYLLYDVKTGCADEEITCRMWRHHAPVVDHDEWRHWHTLTGSFPRIYVWRHRSVLDLRQFRGWLFLHRFPTLRGSPWKTTHGTPMKLSQNIDSGLYCRFINFLSAEIH